MYETCSNRYTYIHNQIATKQYQNNSIILLISPSTRKLTNPRQVREKTECEEIRVIQSKNKQNND